jgi:hypothetical protein
MRGVEAGAERPHAAERADKGCAGAGPKVFAGIVHERRVVILVQGGRI